MKLLVTAVVVVVAGALVAGTARAGARAVRRSAAAAIPVVAAAAASPGATTTSTSSGTVATTSTTSTTTVIPVTSVAAAAWVTTDAGFTFDGIDRRYVVIRPSQKSTDPLPVVVVLHGRWVDPELEVQRTGFEDVTGPAILVYPAGYDQSWNAGACCGHAHDAGLDDSGFVAAVVARVLADEPDASPSHVFVVGYSNGGKLAYALACDHPQLFAAVAAVGTVPVSTCDSSRSMPFIVVANQGDPELTFPSDGAYQTVNGFTMPSVDQEVAALRAANGCAATAAVSNTGALSVTSWPSCTSGDPVSLAVYPADNHDWPAGDASTPSAEATIWSFFAAVAAR